MSTLKTALQDIIRPFPTRFLFRGGSWPVPLVMAWFNFQDRMSMRE